MVGWTWQESAQGLSVTVSANTMYFLQGYSSSSKWLLLSQPSFPLKAPSQHHQPTLNSTLKLLTCTIVSVSKGQFSDAKPMDRHPHPHIHCPGDSLPSLFTLGHPHPPQSLLTHPGPSHLPWAIL